MKGVSRRSSPEHGADRGECRNHGQIDVFERQAGVENGDEGDVRKVVPEELGEADEIAFDGTESVQVFGSEQRPAQDDIEGDKGRAEERNFHALTDRQISST